MSKLCRMFLVLLACGALWAPVPALAEPEDEFLDIVAVIHDADAASAEGKASLATRKYMQAQTNLLLFRKSWPTWNTKVVNYRLAYIEGKLRPAATEQPDQSKDGKAAQKSKGTAGIKVLSPGQGEAKALKFAPTAGATQSLSLKIKIKTEVKVGGMETPATELPAMNIPLSMEVKSVDENGDINYNFVAGATTIVEESGVNPQVLQAMKAASASMKGLSGSGKLSSHGVMLAVNAKPAGSDPQSKQVVDQVMETVSNLALPLPEEPIGPGAKWESKKQVKSQGVSIEQTSTYELVSIEGDTLVVKSDVKQTAGQQKVQVPSMPGMQMDLTKLSGKGGGEITLELTKPFPVNAAMKSQTDTAMNMSMGGQKQPMSTKMHLDVNLSSE